MMYNPSHAAVSCPKCYHPIDQVHADGSCDFDPHEWWADEAEATADIVRALGISGHVEVADSFTLAERVD